VSAPLNPAAGKVEADMVRELRALFARLPEGSRLTSREIARVLCIKDGAAQPLTRAVIARAVKEGFPLGATSEGYAIIRDEATLQQVTNDLEHRERAIRSRRLDTIRAFRTFWRPDPFKDAMLDLWGQG
jgi:hypothetical protein